MITGAHGRRWALLLEPNGQHEQTRPRPPRAKSNHAQSPVARIRLIRRAENASGACYGFIGSVPANLNGSGVKAMSRSQASVSNIDSPMYNNENIRSQ